MLGFRKFMPLFLAAILTAQPLMAAGSAAPRLVSQGSVKLVDSGTLVDREMPAPSGVLMACSKQCFIESNGLQLLAEDGTVFAIRDEADRVLVMVREGNVDFALRADARPLVFETPFDTFETRAHAIPAGSEAVVQGKLSVTAERASLTMTEGSLELVSSDGRRLVESGNAVILAQYKAGAPSSTAGFTEEDVTGGLVAAGAIAIIGAAVLGLAGGGDGGGGGGGGDANEGGEASPF